MTETDAANLVMVNSGSRAKDEFIELYIYGQIVNTVVEKVKIPLTLLDNLKGDEIDQYEELKIHYLVEEINDR